MLTQNAPDFSMGGQLVELRAGKNPTSGGARRTHENDPIVMPYGSPSHADVMTVTPVGKWPSTWRNRAESKSAMRPRLRLADVHLLALRGGQHPQSAAVGEHVAAPQHLVESVVRADRVVV